MDWDASSRSAWRWLNSSCGSQSTPTFGRAWSACRPHDNPSTPCFALRAHHSAGTPPPHLKEVSMQTSGMPQATGISQPFSRINVHLAHRNFRRIDVDDAMTTASIFALSPKGSFGCCDEILQRAKPCPHLIVIFRGAFAVCVQVYRLTGRTLIHRRVQTLCPGSPKSSLAAP